ncbi:MAG: ATP-binding protein [Ignavibacteriae bacterium]|nr:ATP-binding protein [Ignavibacteriota bacterium]
MQNFSKLQTGFSFLDQKWGGVYPGGNYIIIGSKNSGKTLLALNIIEKFISMGLTVLFLSNQRKKSLEIQASSLFFNIHESLSNQNLLFFNTNEFLTSFENLNTLLEKDKPSIIFIDEIVANTFIDSIQKYLKLLEIIEQNNITLFSISSLPDNDEDKKILKEIIHNSTGIIQLQKSSDKRNYSGQLTIKPNIGHIEGEFETTYKVEPVKGFVTLADNENAILNMLSKVNSEYDYISRNQNFAYSNIYNYEEFKLLIESRKSFSVRTNNEITIIVYEIKNGFVETLELCKILQKSLKTGDKISFNNKTIYVLPEKNNSEEINNLLEKFDKNIAEAFKNIPIADDLIARKKISLTQNLNLI